MRVVHLCFITRALQIKESMAQKLSAKCSQEMTDPT